MDGRFREGAVVVGGDARQQFYDARGYGRPVEGGLALAPVEAAHLLYRGDLDAVLVGRDGAVHRQDFEAFLAAGARGFVARFRVYKDLRDRGFYLSPATPPPEVAVDTDRSPSDLSAAPFGRAAGDAPREHDPGYDFEVYPRGKGPWDDAVRYRVRAVPERATVPADTLGDVVLAVMDEEGEISYYETGRLDPGGTVSAAPSPVDGHLLGDGVLAWDPPADLYETGFYGHPFDDREDTGALQLSLVEAAYLAAQGALTLRGGDDAAPTPEGAEGAVEAIVERGRAAEGDHFDRRLRAYRALRDAGLAPKTGFKFGADFRVYREFESPDELGHSEYLVRVLAPDTAFSPRELALDVRLAGGVRKRMVLARPAEDAIDWLTVERLTP